MEQSRPTTGRSADRPVSHRSRMDEMMHDEAIVQNDTLPETRPARLSSASGRPRTRIERPVSRRGSQNSAVRESSARHSPTRHARPTSSVYSAQQQQWQRATTGTSRTGTANNLTRLNTGLPFNSRINVPDRPITQQGISGVVPGTARIGLSINRQIQDKRYYEGLMQLKIRELSQEIGTMSREIEARNKERSTFIHYDNRAKELAAELTELQGQLADYNIVVDKSTSSDQDDVESEIREMSSDNDRTSSEIERLFEQRRSKEQQLRDTDDMIKAEEIKAARIIDTMDQDDREKYDKLNEDKSQIDIEIGMMQREMDVLSSDKRYLEEKISLSQVKQEAVKLRVKLSELIRKRDKLRDDEMKKLSPDEERERLLSKVKQDNMDIAAAERRIVTAEKRIDEVEHELEQLEIDLEEGQSERQLKYKELRKREEAIEQFMPSFESNKREEIDKLKNLEGNVVERLERYSYAIGNGSRITPSEELALLLDKIERPSSSPSSPPLDSTIYDQSLEALSKEHGNLQRTLDKIKMLEKRLNGELEELNNKITERQNELVFIEDLDGFKARSELKYETLTSEKEDLSKRRPIYRDEVDNARKEYQGIKKELEKNETYLRISALEDKYDKLQKNNNDIQYLITEERNCVNYQPLKERAFLLLTKYNLVLGETVKIVTH